MDLTGTSGAFVLLFPHWYRTFATNLLYEHPAEGEWNDRFTASGWIISVVYARLAVRVVKKRRSGD